ncbi:MAG: M24 family metallopeptidase [Chitinophagaceae bacterium]|nr:MAG: M24 family metallopeptidase [Chitinophagaceae bacterium]
MVFYKSKEEIEIMRHSALLVGQALAAVAKIIKPGVTTHDLDQAAEKFITDNGGVPSFKNYRHIIYISGICFGFLIGLVRIAQGGHFFSDVYFSCLII